MTKKRWLLVVMCLASLIGAPILVIAQLTPWSNVGKANFDRVEKGMKFVEVRELFGKQPLDMGSRPGVPFVFFWGDRDGAGATIDFDLNGMVVRKQWSDPTLAQRMRAMLP